MLQQQDLALRQLTTARDYEQATWVLWGGAHWARSILYQDGRISAIDHGGELWASGLPRTDIEQGTVSGEISDQQGLFNVNNLALEERASARDIEAFRRLLEAIGLNADLAQAIADWIDADDEALPVAGAEDDYYLRLGAVSRGEPARGGAQRVLRVRGMDEASLARLRGFCYGAAAAHAGEREPGASGAALRHGSRADAEEARALSTRVQSPFRSLEEFENGRGAA